MKVTQYLLGIALIFMLGSCSKTGKYTNRGDKLFNERGEYMAAIENYQLALARKEKEPGRALFMIGEAYRVTNRVYEAEAFYKRAIDTGFVNEDVLYNYAFALKANGKYTEASEALDKFLKVGTKTDKIRRAKLEVENLAKVQDILAIKNNFEAVNIEGINTPEADYAPFFFQNEIFFTSSRGEGKTYTADGSGFSDLYKFKLDGVSESSGAVVPLDAKINLPNAHEACAALSPDGKMLVFARSNTGSKKGVYTQEVYLYVSYYRNNTWSEATVIPGINDPNSWSSCPAFSADGKTLYFASNRANGRGGIDLYRSKLDKSGRWGKVSNLGSTINTPGDEMFPYITEDGKLYFASDGHPSLGGLDLFVAVKNDEGVDVTNLGTPFNTGYDDFALIYKDGVSGFFCSNRPGGKGNDDIYIFRDRIAKPKNVFFTLEGTVNSYDKKSGETSPLPTTTIKLLDYNGAEISKVVTEDNARFSFDLADATSYTIVAEKEGYLTKRLDYSTRGKRPAESELKEGDNYISLKVDLTLEKVVKNLVIVLENIYYDYNKAEIRPDAAAELDKLVEMLNDNPGIKIELGSHTDHRGKDDYNLKLSQARAESAVEYLISKNIAPERLVARGYGETKPRVLDSETDDFEKGTRLTEKFVEELESEEQKEAALQLNRRTEFRILEVNSAAPAPTETPAPAKTE